MGIKIDFNASEIHMMQFKNLFIHCDKDGNYYHDGTPNYIPHPGISVDFQIEHAYQIFELLNNSWGGWNLAPSWSEMYEIAKQWEEKYQIILAGISHDTVSFQLQRKLDENEIDAVFTQIKNLNAEIISERDGDEKQFVTENKKLVLWWD